jgi:hypothetical protein
MTHTGEGDMVNYDLRDSRGRLVMAAPTFDLITRWLKHEAPDGDYSIEGPDVDATFYRRDGVVYPSGGVIRGERMKPMSLEEAKEFYKGPY